MFADTRHRQVADENEVVRSFGEATFEVTSGIFVQAGEELCEGVSDALRGLQQSVSLRIFTYGEKDFTYRARDALLSVALPVALLVRHVSTLSRRPAARADQEG